LRGLTSAATFLKEIGEKSVRLCGFLKSPKNTSEPQKNFEKDGGAEGIRTPDPHNAIVVLYQLSYDPIQSDVNLKCASELSKLFLHQIGCPSQKTAVTGRR
jgi:hypothetical protein